MQLEEAKTVLEEIGLCDEITPELVEASSIVLDGLEDAEKRLRVFEQAAPQPPQPPPQPSNNPWDYSMLRNVFERHQADMQEAQPAQYNVHPVSGIPVEPTTTTGDVNIGDWLNSFDDDIDDEDDDY